MTLCYILPERRGWVNMDMPLNKETKTKHRLENITCISSSVTSWQPNLLRERMFYWFLWKVAELPSERILQPNTSYYIMCKIKFGKLAIVDFSSWLEMALEKYSSKQNIKIKVSDFFKRFLEKFFLKPTTPNWFFYLPKNIYMSN